MGDILKDIPEKEDRVQINIRVPKDLKDQLDIAIKLVRKRRPDVSQNDVIETIISKFVKSTYRLKE